MIMKEIQGLKLSMIIPDSAELTYDRSGRNMVNSNFVNVWCWKSMGEACIILIGHDIGCTVPCFVMLLVALARAHA